MVGEEQGEEGEAVKVLLWADVADQCMAHGPRDSTVFGIPRGGIHIAQLLVQFNGCALANHPDDAEYIVDDIVDSGRTMIEWQNKHPEHRFWAAYDSGAEWIEFPWERHDTVPSDEDAATPLLQSLEIDLSAQGTADTPARMVRSLREMTSGYHEDPKTILEKRFDATYDEMILVRDIDFYSLCEHHVLPFHGTVTVGYIPGAGGVVGLSKVGRLVQCFAKRLQLQERLTTQIAYAMQWCLEPLGVGVVVKASHLCMAMRGAKLPAEMLTSCLLDRMRGDLAVREEFMSLAGVR